MEVIAAITVFAITVVGVLAMILTGIGSSRDTRNRVTAADVAGQQLELVRAQAVNSFTVLAAAVTPATTIVTVKGLAFTVVQTTGFLSKSVSGGGCNAAEQGANAAIHRELLVTESVTWPAMGSTKPVTTSTLLTPPIGAYPTTGSISITVVNRDNTGVAGLDITVDNGVRLVTATTDSGGCAYVTGLDPGMYTLTATRTGWVDYQEQAPSRQSVLVINGKTASAPFLYDRAATLDVTYVPTTMPPAAGLSVSISNSGLLGTGILTLAGPRLTPLYPYVSGYRIWAGRCSEANPDALNAASGPLYPGHPATTVAIVTPGATSAVDVPVFPLHVDLDKLDKFQTDTIFTATEVPGGAKSPCAAPFTSYALTRPSQTGGKNGSAGGVSITGLPLGTYLVVVDNRKNGKDKIDTATAVIDYSGDTVSLQVK